MHRFKLIVTFLVVTAVTFGALVIAQKLIGYAWNIYAQP